jgi:hypothetical protein
MMVALASGLGTFYFALGTIFRLVCREQNGISSALQVAFGGKLDNLSCPGFGTILGMFRFSSTKIYDLTLSHYRERGA